MVDDKVLRKLSQNLLEILEDNEYYDIIIEVETFQVILRYIYGGVVSLDEYDAPDVIKILVSANELNLQELIMILQSFLIENKSEWIELNFNDVYQMCFENDSFLELRRYCNDLVSKVPDKIFKSLNLSSTSEKVFISLIQNDDLQMSEIQVWEYVLKWGLAQNPELPLNRKDFSENDFNTLKNSLQQFIPSINFYNLSSEEFSKKVVPYRRVLPGELYDELVVHICNNPTKKSEPGARINSKRINSVIITFQHAELILKWINNLGTFSYVFSKFIYGDTTIINNNKFKLLLRGSRDGFTPEKFHEICDDQTHTVTIIKVKDSNEILGGYNPIGWKSNISYGATKDSFIFSFKDNKNIENHILSRVKFGLTAIYSSKDTGPSFSGVDLTLRNNNIGSCSKRSYENQIRETTEEFIVEEYEVFQIVKD
ncbi:carbohydrate-binding module family 13 protein [Rhizophagus clarus]|uniref:Carbohydrate-binding module family 13 protein n=1 Tax=Rhizophagus clarus TaxID=94130 RepID=A0A8H3M1G9_9GLOM|nr:carbohydrate-binding module family 13 protein [Rhizophagus clarus]